MQKELYQKLIARAGVAVVRDTDAMLLDRRLSDREKVDAVLQATRKRVEQMTEWMQERRTNNADN